MLKETYNKETNIINLQTSSTADLIKKYLIEGTFLRQYLHFPKSLKLVRIFDEFLGILSRYYMSKNKQTIENRIVFYTFQGKYTCNCKYIAQKISELYPEFEIIFVLNDKEISKTCCLGCSPNIKFVKEHSAEQFYILATAHFWIDNALCCIWKNYYKRKNQIYLNTWHGSLGIKKLDGKMRWKTIAKYGNRLIDYFITNSTFDENVFRNSFWPDVNHLKVGHPRNDIFFDADKLLDLKKKVYAYYNINESFKVALYAPTFRDNKEDVSAIIMNYTKIRGALEYKFGGKWIILVRPHFHNLTAFKLNAVHDVEDYVIDVSSYDDMQELLASSDVGITDYSSWIFDFLFTRRPAFIYAQDIQNYISSRGFYYPLNQTPFPIANTDTSLSDNIINFDQLEYEKKINVFFKEKGCYENGTASQSVAEFISNNLHIR